MLCCLLSEGDVKIARGFRTVMMFSGSLYNPALAGTGHVGDSHKACIYQCKEVLLLFVSTDADCVKFFRDSLVSTRVCRFSCSMNSLLSLSIKVINYSRYILRV